MVWQGRVYFVSDRDGTMNLWSMDEKGGTLSQHTSHRGWDVTSPDLSERPDRLPARGRPADLRHRGQPGRAAPDPPGLGFRSDAGDLGQEADGLPDREPALARPATGWC